MSDILNNIIAGIIYFFKGVSLLLHPQLRRFVLLPLLANTLFFIGLFVLMIHYYANINVFIMMHIPAWLSVVSILAKFLVVLLYILIMLYSFFTFATIIAAPFNGLLAEKVALMHGYQVVQKTWLAIICDTPRLIGRQLLIVLWYVPISLLLTILLFIPVIHTVVFIFWVWFHARMMALIYLDYPTDNAGVSLRELRQWMRMNKALVFGLGGAILVCSSVPVVNFFVIPAGVIAATNMWFERGASSLGGVCRVD